MSKILCVIDGMSDPSFCADHFAALASFPERSFINTVPEGFAAETLPCILSLLGINPPPKHIRGWIEALGAGIDIRPDDLIFRCSWLSVNAEGICSGFADGPEVVAASEPARYIALNRRKGLLIVPGYASHVGSLRTVMPFDVLGKHVKDLEFPDISSLATTLTRVNRAAHTRVMIPWAPSIVQALPYYPERAAVVCGAGVVRGIAKALHMHLVTRVEMTGDIDTNLHVKLRFALEFATEYPFVLLHIAGCDEAAHRMSKVEKEVFQLKLFYHNPA